MLRVFGILIALQVMMLNSDNTLAEDVLDPELLRAAVSRSIPLLEAGSRGSMTQRKQCFTCHNQGLVVMALSTALHHGIPVDTENLQRQTQFTADFLMKNRAGYLNGKGQGGAAMTAGYALWTLELADWQSDSTTNAVVEYLLQYQADRHHWDSVSNRPPSEKGPFAATYLSLRALEVFGLPSQQQRIAERRDQVREWLVKSVPTDTEDRVFRLWSLQIAGAMENEIRAAAEDLLKTQREDGGWGQLDELPSDAYATGTAMVSLNAAARMSTSDPQWTAGLRFLLNSQLEDGSWHVVTRSKPFQAYFESGYPHGNDQFISITAAGWATTALALAL